MEVDHVIRRLFSRHHLTVRPNAASVRASSDRERRPRSGATRLPPASPQTPAGPPPPPIPGWEETSGI